MRFSGFGKINTALVALVLNFTSVSLAQDPLVPTEHFKIAKPSKLSKVEAEKIYQGLRDAMERGYGLSHDRVAMKFYSWKRLSSGPYLSAGHGSRYLNNFGNKTAQGYLALDEGEKMPFGSIIVKDSFTATAEGKIFPGAMFIMEKLSEEAHPDTGDWRYAMIMPDGSVLGDTTGENPRSMDFCHTCHEDAANTDYLFGIPAGYQAN